MSDGLVTSYFDKLIQVPIKIPHLGIAEVKVYIVLLFMELEVRRNRLKQEMFSDAQNKLSNLLFKAWEDDITVDKIEAVFDGTTKAIMKESVSIADQLAGILVSADNIEGNPRLIKRLLNALEIRKKVAKFSGMTLDSGVLIKMLLFERCRTDFADIRIKYNPDPLERRVGDCAIRACYKAIGRTWNEVFNGLVDIAYRKKTFSLLIGYGVNICAIKDIYGDK